MEKVSLEQVKQRYADQWLAFLVSEEAPTGELLGQLIAHNHGWRVDNCPGPAARLYIDKWRIMVV